MEWILVDEVVDLQAEPRSVRLPVVCRFMNVNKFSSLAKSLSHLVLFLFFNKP